MPVPSGTLQFFWEYLAEDYGEEKPLSCFARPRSQAFCLQEERWLWEPRGNNLVSADNRRLTISPTMITELPCSIL
jgi:hypothetical protein